MCWGVCQRLAEFPGHSTHAGCSAPICADLLQGAFGTLNNNECPQHSDSVYKGQTVSFCGRHADSVYRRHGCFFLNASEHATVSGWRWDREGHGKIKSRRWGVWASYF